MAQDLTYTIGWLIFGMVLLTAGIYLRNRAGRVAAVALIAVTTFKASCTIWRSLGGLYRVGVARRPGGRRSRWSSLALQKFVLRAPKEPHDAARPLGLLLAVLAQAPAAPPAPRYERPIAVAAPGRGGSPST